jgi:hypothetical protein
MELLIIVLALVILVAASAVAGADSRPGLDDEPRRSI